MTPVASRVWSSTDFGRSEFGRKISRAFSTRVVIMVFDGVLVPNDWMDRMYMRTKRMLPDEDRGSAWRPPYDGRV